MAKQTIIPCPFCARLYVWKPSVAGKKITCKCNAIFDMPAEPPAPSLSDDVAPPPTRSASIVTAPKARSTSTAASNPAIAPYMRPRKLQHLDERPGNIRAIVLTSALLICFVAAIFAYNRFSSSRAAATTAPVLKGDDAKVVSLQGDVGMAEATDWFGQSSRQNIAGLVWTREQALRHIRSWYDLGAKKVYAFGGNNTPSLAIELPTDPAQRRALITVAEQFRQEHHPQDPPITDVGQTYVLIEFW